MVSFKGVVCVIFSFGFMFNLCPTCENSPLWARFIYYAPFVVIFQFGWASTQISHLALIPQLSHCENERVNLNAIRYAFTVMSNLFVYTMAYIFFKYNEEEESDHDISRADSTKFMYLSFIMLSVGVIFQMIFHVGTDEKGLRRDREEEDLMTDDEDHDSDRLDWIGYLKEYRFYAVC